MAEAQKLEPTAGPDAGTDPGCNHNPQARFADAGNSAMQAGRYAEAADAFAQARRDAPNDGRLLFLQGYALLRLRRWAEALALLRAASMQRVPIPNLAELAAYAEFRLAGKDLAEFSLHGETVRFRIADLNLGLDIFHVGGRFFEAAELEHCRALVAPGAVIVDVGANVGNHLVYFGRFMRPQCIIPFEPHPQAIRLLRENITLNAIDCVDTRHLGQGIGGEPGHLSLAMAPQGDLVLARLIPADQGEIPVIPLDQLALPRVDLLKVDVEGMEFAALSGMKETLRRCRPILMVEVREEQVAPFVERLRALDYRLERSFPGIGYRNLFFLPPP